MSAMAAPLHLIRLARRRWASEARPGSFVQRRDCAWAWRITVSVCCSRFAKNESILLHAARLDGDRPLVDLAFDKGLQIGGGLALRRHNDEAECMKALPEGGISHHRHQRLVELFRQRRRCALGQEYGVPGIGVEAG